MKFLNIPTATPYEGGYVRIIGLFHSKEEAEKVKAECGVEVFQNGREYFLPAWSPAKGSHTVGYVTSKINWCNTPWNEVANFRSDYDDSKFLHDTFDWELMEAVENDPHKSLGQAAYIRAALQKNGGVGNEIPDVMEFLRVYMLMGARNNVVWEGGTNGNFGRQSCVLVELLRNRKRVRKVHVR